MLIKNNKIISKAHKKLQSLKRRKKLEFLHRNPSINFFLKKKVPCSVKWSVFFPRVKKSLITLPAHFSRPSNFNTSKISL